MELPQELFGMKGWFPEPYHEKDFLYEPLPVTTAEPHANLRDSDNKYRGYWGKIYDQGAVLNSCVANAAAALFTFELNKELAILKKQAPPIIDPSRRFIWYNARKIENIKPAKFRNAACHTRSAMKALQKDGVCDEPLCPYPALDDADAVVKSDKEPELTAKGSAKAYKIAWYGRLDKKRSPGEREVLADKKPEEAAEEKNKDGEDLKEKLCKAITEGYPVIFGIHYYKKDPNSQFSKRESGEGANKWSLTELTTRHEKPPHGCPSHAVLAIGYDKNFVVCQTSYGQEYFDQGTFLAPWAWITDFEATEDFWAMRFFQAEGHSPPQG